MDIGETELKQDCSITAMQLLFVLAFFFLWMLNEPKSLSGFQFEKPRLWFHVLGEAAPLLTVSLPRPQSQSCHSISMRFLAGKGSKLKIPIFGQVILIQIRFTTQPHMQLRQQSLGKDLGLERNNVTLGCRRQSCCQEKHWSSCTKYLFWNNFEI